jgi:hypothetical protein
MDRAELEARLAKSSVRPETRTVRLPVWGESLALRRPTREQGLQVVEHGGDGEGQLARLVVGALRFSLLDDDGHLLLRSYGEASAMFNALDDEDMAVLMPEVMALLQQATEGTAGGDVTAGKAS